ncbi:ATP-dependent helicase C-terminal domain-containing protein [Streptosporangium soli]|nr:hypothetical protein [Streptosporangium sp. KLBMP 9127]
MPTRPRTVPARPHHAGFPPPPSSRNSSAGRTAGVPLLIHLLSPADRPTADLASFWREGYHADLRGRYPRHPWPEDPLSATPTRRLNHRRQTP